MLFKSNLISILIERDNSDVFVPTLHKSHLCFYSLTDTIEHHGGPQTSPTLNQGWSLCGNIIESRSSCQCSLCAIYCVEIQIILSCHISWYKDSQSHHHTQSQSLSLVSPNPYSPCILNHYCHILVKSVFEAGDWAIVSIRQNYLMREKEVLAMLGPHATNSFYYYRSYLRATMAPIL